MFYFRSRNVKKASEVQESTVITQVDDFINTTLDPVRAGMKLKPKNSTLISRINKAFSPKPISRFNLISSPVQNGLSKRSNKANITNRINILSNDDKNKLGTFSENLPNITRKKTKVNL